MMFYIRRLQFIITSLVIPSWIRVIPYVFRIESAGRPGMKIFTYINPRA